jgi:hypothetical protein
MNDLGLANRVLVSMMTAAAFIVMTASGIVAYVIPHGRIELEVFMKTLRFLLVSLLIVSIGLVTSSFGGEFYVVKSRSGLLRIVDHLPKGGATVVNGPFSSKEEASKAMKAPTQGTGDTVKPPSGGGPTPIK